MLRKILRRWLGITDAAAPTPPAQIKVSPQLLASSSRAPVSRFDLKRNELKIPLPAPGVIPPGEKLAMDDSMSTLIAWGNQASCGLYFPGYGYLAELSQRSEYRSPVETLASEMTRKWIELKGTGSKDHGTKLEELTQALKDFNVQECFRKATELDAQFGCAKIYIHIKGAKDTGMRDKPLVLDKASIGKGCLEGFKVLEPIWTTPLEYNSIDPTEDDFYKPSSWYVMGQRIHATRLIDFVSRPVPDILKPSYNFGGISLNQLMEPYVNAWLRTRDSVNDLIHNFSILALQTNLATTLQGDPAGSELLNRSQFFRQTRDNQGVMLLDKDTEALEQLAVPLGTLDKLQAQAQEHMASVCHEPLIKLFGITPSGLNASAEDEITCWNDYAASMQARIYNTPLTTVLQLLQLHLYGEIDPTITFAYVPLREPDGEALARERKTDAEAATAYINSGVIDPDEERERLATDPLSGYDNLSGPAPGPPQELTPEIPDSGGDN